MRPDFNKMELIPAIVQDYQTKEVLMLAYVNEEAYDQMLEILNKLFFIQEADKSYGIKEKNQDIFKILRECI